MNYGRQESLMEDRTLVCGLAEETAENMGGRESRRLEREIGNALLSGEIEVLYGDGGAEHPPPRKNIYEF